MSLSKQDYELNPMTLDSFKDVVCALAERSSNEALKIWLVLLLKELRDCTELPTTSDEYIARVIELLSNGTKNELKTAAAATYYASYAAASAASAASYAAASATYAPAAASGSGGYSRPFQYEYLVTQLMLLAG